MGRKQYQSQDRYARTGSQAKKRRSQRFDSRVNTFSASKQETVTGDGSASTPRPTPVTGIRQTQVIATPYPYVVSDLIHTAIITVIAFVILVVLYFVL